MRVDGLVVSLAVLGSLSCAVDAVDAREAFVVDALTAADLHYLRARPDHVAGKYARMARGVYDFFRGSAPLLAADLRTGTAPEGLLALSTDAILPHSVGDAHPENFGVVHRFGMEFALEPNDLDAADRWPAGWDLSRLAVGLVVGARTSSPQDPVARSEAVAAEERIVEAAVLAYAAGLCAIASGAPRGPTIAGADSGAIVSDVFNRSMRDAASREELAELTELAAGARRLRRGVLDPAEPEELLVDLPGLAAPAIAELLQNYRASLVEPPSPSFFALKDAVRQLGSGVASWPRLRMLALVEGPSASADDDVILELKELGESGARGWEAPRRPFPTVTERVLAGRRLWHRPDAEPLWGAGALFGAPVQVRNESEGQKTIRTARWEGSRGGAAPIEALARTLGALLARIHSTPTDVEGAPARLLCEAIGADAPGLARRIAAGAAAYATTVEEDHRLFVGAIRSRGPTLGFEADPRAAIPVEWRALLAVPAPRTPIP